VLKSVSFDSGECEIKVARAIRSTFSPNPRLPPDLNVEGDAHDHRAENDFYFAPRCTLGLHTNNIEIGGGGGEKFHGKLGGRLLFRTHR
jgi:hypothetical protein